MTDIMNAYLLAVCIESNDADKRALVVQALCGVKSAGTAFWNHLAHYMKLMMYIHFVLHNKLGYYSHALLHVDDALCIYHYMESVLICWISTSS